MAASDTSDLAPTLWERLPRAWRVALVAYVVTRVPLGVFAWLIRRFLPVRLHDGHFLYHGGAPHDVWLVDAFQKWDAYWFLNIVREGYQFHGVVEQVHQVTAGVPETNVTPFPLYPGLMWLGERLIGDAAVAGLVISQVCLFMALVLLHRLVSLDRQSTEADLAVWLLAVVPWTYAFSAIYSESLFVMLTLAAVVAVRRGWYVRAGVAGVLSAATRLPGVLVVLPLLIEGGPWRGRERGWRWLWLLAPLLGTLGYFGYLWHLTGEPTAYFIGQQGWHKELVGPLFHPIRWLTAADFTPEMLQELVVTVVVVLTLAAGFRRVRWSDWTYGLVGFGILVSSSYLLGLPRYCSALYPLYLIWAGLGTRHPALGRALLVSFAMLAPAVFWVWTSWRYAF